jgi:diaminopimelate epimerase
LNLWDACGNRLLVLVEEASDDELVTRSERARACFDGEARFADGIAWFAPRAGWYRTAFFNPDGSRERMCGNSLLVAAAVLAETGPVVVTPFEHDPIEIRSHTLAEARARVPLTSVFREPRPEGPVFDTGSPHLVIAHPDTEAIDLDVFAQPFLDTLDVNVTLYALAGDSALVRTFERGVNAETGACGTGALAVALAVGRPLEIRYRGGAYRVSALRDGDQVEWSLATAREHVRSVVLG